VLYKRVEVIDGETPEPVQFIGVYTLRWPKDLEAEVAFVEDEDATDRLAAYDAALETRPEVVCLCGSTRFVGEYDNQMLKFTLEGKIVLTIGTHNSSDEDLARKYADGFEDKKPMLDELHKRKIDLADCVFVINVGGYIGDSTHSEIEYADRLGKPIRFLE